MGQPTVPVEDLIGYADFALHHVSMDLEIAGLLVQPDRADNFVDIDRRAERIVDDFRRARHLSVDAKLRLDLLRLVVDEHAELALLLAWAAADYEDRYSLGERASDRIHHVVAARTVGDADAPMRPVARA